LKFNCTALLIPVFAISIILMSCGGTQNRVGSEESLPGTDVTVEAYLFDVQLRRNGKPTSIRLDLYQTDSAVAIFGRGYFNKGAFRGRLTDDSLQIYFPSAHEYVNESVEKLFRSFDCESELMGINLLSYFTMSPDSTQISENLMIAPLENAKGHKTQRISSRNCDWQLTLEYAIEEAGWRIDRFDFNDGKEVTLKGSRRNYKDTAKVSSERFLVLIPANAKRISL